MSRYLIICSLLLLPLFVGCRSTEMLETALRVREQDMLTLRQEIVRMEFHNQALQHEVRELRTFGSFRPSSPSYAAQHHGLRRITLGRMTGGYDDDRLPGDEALQVVIEPRDSQDDVIKSPGAIQVTALAISTQGLKTPIGVWNYSPGQVRRSWKRGLFSTGYVLTLPWKQRPQDTSIRVVVQFEMSDGRVFEADKDITIDLPYAPNPGTSSGIVPIPKQENLPQPRTLNPNTGPNLQQTSHWHAPSLANAVRLLRPVDVYPEAPY